MDRGKLANCGGTSPWRGGVAGDQSGGEYKITEWYMHQNGWDGVLRYEGENKENVRKAIASVGIKAAQNDHIGYDMDQRHTYFEQLEKVNWDPSKITVDCESDCSASSSAAAIAAGYICNVKMLQKISSWNWTGSMVSDFTAHGFKWLTGSAYTASDKNLIVGDIILNTSHHATVFIGSGDVEDMTPGGGGGPLNMQDAIKLLYSSDNYEFIQKRKEKQESKIVTALKQTVKDFVSYLYSDEKIAKDDEEGKSIAEYLKKKIDINLSTQAVNVAKSKQKRLTKGNLLTFPNLVEAPYIEVSMNGIQLGGYGGAEDKYPNHIVSLDIDKINGRINQYSISILHQVRAGEDPNYIDSLLSRTGVRNKIKIKYGDSAYGAYYEEKEAYIINVSYNESVTSSKIVYTINAVSSVGSEQYAYFDFKAVESKPSHEIINLLYHDDRTSRKLLESLGGMRSEQATLGKGLIPTDDAIVKIPGLKGATPEERLRQLVTYMTDPLSPESNYFLSFEDGANNNAIFKITKVTGNSRDTETTAKNCYYLDVGYPGNAFVTNFTLNNDVYWPMYYKWAQNIPYYNYDIDYNGQLITQKTNVLTISDKWDATSLRKTGWWNFVNNYPISASITVKGLMKPITLIENVYIYAQFYGQKDLATGLYTIVGQHDSIKGNGYTTTLQLLKVQN